MTVVIAGIILIGEKWTFEVTYFTGVKKKKKKKKERKSHEVPNDLFHILYSNKALGVFLKERCHPQSWIHLGVGNIPLDLTN